MRKIDGMPPLKYHTYLLSDIVSVVICSYLWCMWTNQLRSERIIVKAAAQMQVSGLIIATVDQNAVQLKELAVLLSEKCNCVTFPAAAFLHVVKASLMKGVAASWRKQIEREHMLFYFFPMHQEWMC